MGKVESGNQSRRDVQLSNRLEIWLNSPERDLVRAGVSATVGDAIQSVLPKVAKNFSPNECAEIISSAVNEIATEQDFAQLIAKWVEDYQMGTFEGAPIAQKDLGVWNRLHPSQDEKS